MKPDYAETDESIPGAVRVGFTDPVVLVERLLLWEGQDARGEGEIQRWLSGDVHLGPEGPPVHVEIEIPPDSALLAIASHDGPSMALAAARMLTKHAQSKAAHDAPVGKH